MRQSTATHGNQTPFFFQNQVTFFTTLPRRKHSRRASVVRALSVVPAQTINRVARLLMVLVPLHPRFTKRWHRRRFSCNRSNRLRTWPTTISIRRSATGPISRRGRSVRRRRPIIPNTPLRPSRPTTTWTRRQRRPWTGWPRPRPAPTTPQISRNWNSLRNFSNKDASN